MKSRDLVVAAAAVLGLSAFAAVAAAPPSSTAFTYQGELRQGGAPASGVYDLRIELYDGPTGGNLLGSASLAGVEVKDGAFTVLVDFGLAPPACGSDRFLETHVRPAGGQEYTRLSPRQPMKSKSDCTVDGSVTVTANLKLPATAASGGNPTAGVLFLGGSRFLHSYGSYNTFLGTGAGSFGLTGGENTGSGFHSLHNLTTGSYDTAMGAYSLAADTDGADNTATGDSSLQYNTTGNDDTANGFLSLYRNTTGSDNTASGSYCLWNNTTAGKNTAVGSGALWAQSYDPGTGPWDSENTAVGFQALYFNQPASAVTGVDNTALGGESLYSNTAGYDNTAIGFQSLYNNQTGAHNIAIGYQAGYAADGDYNIHIGHTGYAGYNHEIRIGDSNQTSTYIAGIYGTYLINPSPVYITSDGHLGLNPSSIRFKRDVQDMGEASGRLLELRPVTFHYKAQPDGPLQYGLIAEEVERVMPELVLRDATGQVESVAYHEMPAMLLNELQKQRATIQAQQAQIDELRRMVQALLDERSVTGATVTGGR